MAAATAASAQVSISGLIGMQIQKANGDTSYGLHDGNIKFAASEDLGGGMKVSAATEIRAGGRLQGDVTTRDASVTLSGAFGSVLAANYEAGNGIIGRGYAGAPVIGADDNVLLDGGSNTAALKYTAPTINGFTASIGLTSTTGSLNGTLKPTLAVAYKAGALDASIDYQPKTERMRASMSYDLGVAKVGVGFTEMEDFDTSVLDQSTTVFGVSVPLGAATVGLAVSNNSTANTDALDIGAAYALSKRTEVSVAMQKVSSTPATTRVRLSHSF